MFFDDRVPYGTWGRLEAQGLHIVRQQPPQVEHVPWQNVFRGKL